MTRKELNQLYQKLERYKDFGADEQNCEKFLETIDEIIRQQDATSLPVLLQYFDDNTEYSWVLENLMLSLDSYPAEAELMALFNDFERLSTVSPRWTKNLFIRLLNDTVAFKTLTRLLRLQPAGRKEAFLTFIEPILRSLSQEER